jgi:hypothetical protein
MKTQLRRDLARLPFEEKIRKVGELIRLSRNIKEQRVRKNPLGLFAIRKNFTDRGGQSAIIQPILKHEKLY